MFKSQIATKRMNDFSLNTSTLIYKHTLITIIQEDPRAFIQECFYTRVLKEVEELVCVEDVEVMRMSSCCN